MLVDVETFLFYSLANTYTYTLIYYLEDNVGNHRTAVRPRRLHTGRTG